MPVKGTIKVKACVELIDFSRFGFKMKCKLKSHSFESWLLTQWFIKGQFFENQNVAVLNAF